ncbi:acetyl/propionyl/methylcrotonyl-CoA carboxylase subunit alpha [Rothia nasimurium]|uniref:acetyl-CoA carboxylase biotin carboxylase subunit n=1 Tax=Rothia nasimurium TaxID=85336 RepID=UPI001628A0D8|nr:acetyl-CoA carboxylase biotin carboxylase subunit [Rothia nasimurium]
MQKLFIANRGEIARRIIRTAKPMGIKTVLAVSEADTETPAAQEADECVVVGPALVQQSYLNKDALIQAALDSKADAVHPGFGFLSENSDFAQKVIDAGLIWVGPSPTTISLMGNKSAALEAAKQAGVPVLEGSDGPLQNLEEAQTIAESIGYPLLVKASAGGGGRGIRLVETPADLISTIELAQAEAEASFGDGTVYLERFVRTARHVEVQIFGDGENYIHLGDRDCSYQRRSQKVLEEAPAPNLPEDVRQEIRETSVRLAANSGYIGAGTVEFVYDTDKKVAAFIEMNTRLQVEHPVTEEITGLDLVELQLRVASGEKLSLQQDDIVFEGSAIECRLNAEDPSNNFFPSPGTIASISWPQGENVRIDSGVEAESEISPYYDSMFAKLIVRGSDRSEAIANTLRALNSLKIEGIKTTKPLHQALLERDEFKQVTHHTKFIESTPDLLEREQ